MSREDQACLVFKRYVQDFKTFDEIGLELNWPIDRVKAAYAVCLDLLQVKLKVSGYDKEFPVRMLA